MSVGSAGGFDSGEWLERLAGDLPLVRLNARSAAELVTSTHCSARRALDAARINKAKLAERLGSIAEPGQSPFAIGRGNQFEKAVKRDEFSKMLGLLRERGVDTLTVDIVSLRDDIPYNGAKPDEVLAARAKKTREEIVSIATGNAPAGRILDGAALEWDIGGTKVRLETDALAWWVGEKLRIVEIKSFPVEWGQIPKEKVIAAAWQTAVYVAAVEDLLSANGLDPSLISRDIFLVCPQNTGLKPTIIEHDVSPQLRLLRRFESQELSIEEIARLAGDISFGVDTHDDSARKHAAGVVRELRPSYQTNCLTTCELARHCRSCAQESGEAGVIGGQAVQITSGVADLRRAAALLNGATVAAGEEDFVALAQAIASSVSMVKATR